MTPDAEGAASRSPYLNNRSVVSVGSGICAVCGANLSSSGGSNTRICERCLFDLSLESCDPDAFGDDDQRPPSVQGAPTLGPYALLEEIGRGGQGVVYRALHRDTNEVLAVKTVLPQDVGSAETLIRFQREAAAAQGLAHPYAMPVREVGCSHDGVPYFSMKLAQGGNLHELGSKYRGRWRQIAELVGKVSRAVQHAHEQGILHRDLKPGNILFTDEHEPLVTDFGLAKHLTGATDLTQSCAVLGTPHYVSPEQAAGRTKDLTATSDIYSLGAILFELLTGRPPFVGDDALDVLRQAASCFPKRPRTLVPSIPKTLESICMRCLERRPEDRYGSAHDLSADLECWLQGRKIASRPIYLRLKAIVRRRPTLFAWLLGGSVAALLAFSAFRISSSKPTRDFVHMVQIAVGVDCLDRDPFLEILAHQTSVGLERQLNDGQTFIVPEVHAHQPPSSSAIFDPLAYGRAANAQVMLAGSIRHSKGFLRLTTRLLRCDTGEVVWRRVDSLPAEQNGAALGAAIQKIVEALRARWLADAKAFARPTRLAPVPEAQVFYTKAMELAGHKNRPDLDAALTLFQRAAAIDPHFTQARAMYAFALWSKANTYGAVDQLPRAMAVAREALLEDPDSAQAHRVIASCYFKEARYEEASDEFWNAVELDPSSAGCYQSLGICLREMGHPGQAIPLLVRAAQLAPARGAFSASLGETLVLCGRDEEADKALQHAADLDSDRPESQLALSALRAWQKHFDEARQLCAKTRARFPDCRYGLSLAAWIELCDGKTQEAQTHFEQLRAENFYQQNWECYGAVNPSSGLAYVASRVGSNDKARQFAREAITIDMELLSRHPRNPRILHDLAATYAVLGDFEKAQRLVEEAIACGWVEHRSTRIDPRFALLAGDPRFNELLDATFPKAR